MLSEDYYSLYFSSAAFSAGVAAAAVVVVDCIIMLLNVSLSYKALIFCYYFFDVTKQKTPNNGVLIKLARGN